MPLSRARPTLTRRFGLELCRQFFGLSQEDEDRIAGQAGLELLQSIWDTTPELFDEDPLVILRQEWFHAYSGQYRHLGFWDALDRDNVVLDYGAGVGAVTQPWIARGGRTILVEKSRIALAYLLHKYGRRYPNVQIWTLEDALDAPPIVDALVCTDVLEHTSDPVGVQETIWGWLRVGGQALLKLESAYPHPGHTREATLQFDAWLQWVQARATIIETETYLWAQKREGVLPLPVTEPPVTEPPTTEPPVTEPPVTEPPVIPGG